MTERFMIDDAGTLIDMQTRDMFDIVEEVVDLLNTLNDENEQLKENIGIILKYCRDKGKYAMNMKEIEAHNILQRIVNDLEGDDGMTEKRFTITQDFEEHHRQIRDNGHIIMGCFIEPQAEIIVDLLNELHEENQELKRLVKVTVEDYTDLKQSFDLIDKENEQLRKENNKLHQKIFEMRTNIALERTEISKQTYTGKKNEKEYLDAKEFLDELEKW